MDVPSFLLEIYKNNVALVEAIAWPIVAFSVIWMFRRQIAVKIADMASYEGIGGKVGFHKAMDVAGKSDSGVIVLGDDKPAATGLDKEPNPQSSADQQKRLSDTKMAVQDLVSDFIHSGAPAGSGTMGSLIISEIFSGVAAELRRVAGTKGYTPTNRKRLVGSMLDDLMEARAINPDLATEVRKLLELRNIAWSQPKTITLKDAERYIKWADEVKNKLKALPVVQWD